MQLFTVRFERGALHNLRIRCGKFDADAKLPP